MSNPAVTRLGETYLGRTEVWLDDNIGESVHLHIEDIRVDFSVENFKTFCEEVNDVVNELIDVEGFDIRKVDPLYFEDMLWENISHLQKVDFDEVMLGDMLCPADDGTLVYLPDSRLVKALRGDDSENRLSRNSDHVNQSSSERLDEVNISITKNGYPLNEQYIIMYNDDNIIQDGQHRAASLYVENGNVPIKVKRFIFDNYKTRSMKKPFEYTLIGELAGDARHPMAWLRKKIDHTINKREEKKKTRQLNDYLAQNENDYRESLRILSGK